ncbi:MAG: GBS Bsp-like repeat-containing protein [Lachnospiraceae bacterium]|nr:GBS Bsp-like repeat-containing protein [Lachnospiraceae bacterium]
MKNRKRWLSLLLAAGMLVNSPVLADVDYSMQTITESEIPDDSIEDAEAEEILEESRSEQQNSENMQSTVSIASEESDGAAEDAVKPSVDWIDHGDGNIDLTLQEYTPEENVKAVLFAVWSARGGQDDIKWYTAADDLTVQFNTKKHGDDLGDYYVHVYASKADGSMEFICDTRKTVSVIERSDPVLTAEDKNGDETVFALKLENFEKNSDTNGVRVAVWSAEKGQDDLAWYTLQEQPDGTFTADLVTGNHKSSGSYYLHVYEQKKNGSTSFITEDSLTVSGFTQGTITVSDVDLKEGTCTVTLSDVTTPSGISEVKIPVWSKSNQSDIKWYTAKKRSDGSYRITVAIANHKNNLGTYQIHAYATSNIGFTQFVGKSTVEFKADSAKVTAEKEDEKYQLKTEEIAVPGGLTAVRYAVWSKENNQSDLKWFETEYDADTAAAGYSLSLKGFKAYGEYIVHCYGVSANGSLVFLGNTSFTVEKPSLESVTAETDNEKGTFTVTVKGLNSGSGVSKVQVPIWSKANQSDIVWYTAEKIDDTTYQVKSSIAKHSYNTGTYHAHVYITEVNGINSYLDKADFSFAKSFDGVEVGEGKEQQTFPVTVKNVTVPTGAKNVKVAVWSKTGGQDDVNWYTLSGKNGGNYTGTIKISNHKTQGTYYVHAYVETRGGTMEFLGNTEFEVKSTAKASIAVTGIGSSNSAFTVQVAVNETNASISSVQVPVWTKSDQSDLYWYTATKQSDGTWTVKVAISNHKYNLGTYQIHAYTTFTNGIQIAAGAASYTFNPSNILTSSKIGSGKREITLRNAGSAASTVQFAVWSDTKGQDDIVWYTASKQSNGNWTATVKSANHKSSGKYQIHAYVNGSFVSNNTFTFAASEMVKNGWYYENGYKFYYSNGKKLTDLTSIIGAQSSYVAYVNRTTCTITIYANDPDSSKGYIIPVKAFTCSVGLPGTPTTAGVHYTFAKYRWKELMGPSWGQYATKVTHDGIYFHSVAGVNTTSYNLNYIDYNNLGIPASHGCIRLCVRDAKWIYDNCPLGMKVVVYDSADPGPYGKPATIKIPAGQTWDPTDPAIG